MTRIETTLLASAGALLLTAAQPLPTLDQTQPGLWEVSGAPGAKAPVRLCVADVPSLALFEHRGKACKSKVLKRAGTLTALEYSCGTAGFGHSDVEALTPRSLKISTQGISDGLPFNYVLQARRTGDCAKSTAPAGH
jgi:hypothetical protein